MRGKRQAKKKFDGIVKPRLTRWCKNCGEMFAAKHVVDDEQYCERCRNECKQQEDRK